MYSKVAGTKDILPQEVYCWQEIENISRAVFSLYNFQEIRTALIEDADLFNRSLGEAAEIVQKQMFLIKNKDETYCLRPEGTASIARSYIENSIHKTDGFVKFYYIGPMFRLERPQKGRLRQFHHIGVEAIGSSDPALDAEIISLTSALLNAFSITGYTIKLNSLGCPKDKKELAIFLHDGLSKRLDKLCTDCKVRFNKNVLRILDCKVDTCKQVVSGLEIKNAHLCSDCAFHFQEVLQGLDSLGVNYKIDPYLVRGLDYYMRTVFEISQKDLGSQDAIGAGGRYDNLISQLGGPDTPAIGFAFGIERLLLASSQGRGEHCLPVGVRGQARNQGITYLITLGDEAKKQGIKLLAALRQANVSADIDYENKSLKAAMRKADKLDARFVLMLGENELKNGVLLLKDMRKGEQKEVKGVNECIEHIRAAS